MFGRQATEEMTFAELHPNERFVLTAYSHGTSYRVEHRFIAEANGTRLSIEFEGVAKTLAARLMMPVGRLFLGSLKRQLETDLKDLKREVELRHGGSTAS